MPSSEILTKIFYKTKILFFAKQVKILLLGMLGNKKLYILILALFIGLTGMYFLGLFVLAENDLSANNMQELQVVSGTTLLAISSPPEPEVARKLNVMVTAYSSTEAETDDTPFITASGEEVRDGIIANNLLAFNTQVRLPELYGDRIFIVKDRMNRKKGNYHVDVWFPSREQALEFGAKTTTMEILAN